MPATVRLRNCNPLGAVDLPLLGLLLEAGAEFDCPADLAPGLLEQVGNYEAVKSTKKEN